MGVLFVYLFFCFVLFLSWDIYHLLPIDRVSGLLDLGALWLTLSIALVFNSALKFMRIS